MKEIIEKKERFQHYPCALYTTDVQLHHANSPQGNQHESKLYYSGIHHLYGYRVKILVSPLGRAVHVSPHYPGSKADSNIFRRELEKHKRNTKKYNDSTVSDSII